MTVTLRALGLTALVASRAVALDVTTCGQRVPPETAAVLQTDLSCSGPGTCDDAPGTACSVDGDCPSGLCDLGAVILGRNASLSLNGHTITSTGARVGVSVPPRSCPASGICIPTSGRVAVQGPGTISGGTVGISSFSRRTTVSDVQLHDIGDSSSGAGIAVVGDLVATGVGVTRVHIGVQAKSVRATDLGVSSSGIGILTHGAVRGVRLTITDNGPATIQAGVLDGAGIFAERCRLTDSVATGNFDGSVPADLLTKRRPLLVNTTCDHSAVVPVSGPPTATWGVCADD
jgi:hypothetical protein